MKEIEQSIQQAALIARHLQQRLSPAEQAALEAWLAESPENQRLFEELTNEAYLKEELKYIESISVEKGWKKVQAAMPTQATVVPIASWKRAWWMAAAAVAIAGSLWVAYRYTFNEQQQAIAQVEKKETPAIVPGGNKATLTLADGSIIELDSAGTGELASQGTVKIIKLEGKIAYSAETASSEPVYNTISTPKGGQYQLEMADGSRVWLNAASSVRFPALFSGPQRVVEMTGECYFEVAKDNTKPFKVKVNHVEVLVTGTHFNVNGYQDETSNKVTLAEGSVQVNAGMSTVKLLPGQQAQANGNGVLELVKNADLDEVLAWKEGSFVFNSADVPTIMRQLSRWYNVEVNYQGAVSNETFSGIVSRQSNIARVLKIMEAGGVKFKTEGNKITVYN
jgi:ferric-dicitrate binding protein FerR (iron transport regulator)